LCLWENRRSSHFFIPINHRHFVQEENLIMKKFWLLILVFVTLMGANPALADDGLYVVAVGGVGTKINSVPYTISSPGFYYLGGNLTYSGTGYAITVNTSQVTLDLMGFSLTGLGTTSERGISVNGNNVEVRNGSVIKFNYGIYANGLTQRLANLKASNCYIGIYLNAGYNSIITNCQASSNTSGITVNGSAVIIDKNTVRNNSSNGISTFVAGIITNNVATSNGTGFYLGGATYQLVDRNCSHGNTTNWSGLSGCTQGLNTP
jgi:parallel beta-helix repeat protein